ncbi:MAG: hypothetical protein EPN86_00900 [Nanoarchaeota archaeon]|nr:MAG: hypothetical protein EPN86_00900 [Nanoarchaeota archaeon]
MPYEFQPFHYGKAEDPQHASIGRITGSVVIGLGLLMLVVELFSPTQQKQLVVPAIYLVVGAGIFGIDKIKLNQ